MADYTDFLNQYLAANPADSITPVTPAVPATADAAMIAQASNDPMSALTTNIAMDRGNTLTTNNQIINDFQNMSAWDFRGKYGPDIIAQMDELSAARQEYTRRC